MISTSTFLFFKNYYFLFSFFFQVLLTRTLIRFPLFIFKYLQYIQSGIHVKLIVFMKRGFMIEVIELNGHFLIHAP